MVDRPLQRNPAQAKLGRGTLRSELRLGHRPNTPSELQMTEGDHAVAVKKAGFKDWQRNLSVSAGSTVHLNAYLESAVASQ